MRPTTRRITGPLFNAESSDESTSQAEACWEISPLEVDMEELRTRTGSVELEEEFSKLTKEAEMRVESEARSILGEYLSVIAIVAVMWTTVGIILGSETQWPIWAFTFWRNSLLGTRNCSARQCVYTFLFCSSLSAADSFLPFNKRALMER